MVERERKVKTFRGNLVLFLLKMSRFGLVVVERNEMMTKSQKSRPFLVGKVKWGGGRLFPFWGGNKGNENWTHRLPQEKEKKKRENSWRFLPWRFSWKRNVVFLSSISTFFGFWQGNKDNSPNIRRVVCNLTFIFFGKKWWKPSPQYFLCAS